MSSLIKDPMPIRSALNALQAGDDELAAKILADSLESYEGQVRESVAWFAQQMEAKLRENDHKGGWENDSLSWLYTRMIEEAEEVKTEIKAAIEREIDYSKIIREAADVANFAMMIADVARRINTPEGDGNDA